MPLVFRRRLFYNRFIKSRRGAHSYENRKKTVVSAAQENYITELTQDIQSDELRSVLQSLGKSIWRKHEQEEN